MNQTEDWPVTQHCSVPPPPQDKTGQDQQLWQEWAFHLPFKLGNLCELLLAVTESFSPKAL